MKIEAILKLSVKWTILAIKSVNMRNPLVIMHIYRVTIINLCLISSRPIISAIQNITPEI